MTKPTKASQKLLASDSVGYYFESDRDVVFVWRKPAGKVQVERWTAPAKNKEATIKIDGFAATLTRVF